LGCGLASERVYMPRSVDTFKVTVHSHTSKWDEATYVKDESVFKQLWRVFCLVEMKDKLLDGPMTCCVRFGKLEDPLKLDGVCCPAFHVGSANVG
jgi:hypothetical protein